MENAEKESVDTTNPSENILTQEDIKMDTQKNPSTELNQVAIENNEMLPCTEKAFNKIDETLKEQQEAKDTLNEIANYSHESIEKYPEGLIENDKPEEEQRATEELKEPLENYQSTQQQEPTKQHDVSSSAVKIIEVIKIVPVPEEISLPQINHTTEILSSDVSGTSPSPELDTIQVSNDLVSSQIKVVDDKCSSQEIQVESVMETQVEASVGINVPNSNVVSSSLSLLAQYNSENDDEDDSDEKSIKCDTDSESVIEVPPNSGDYRNRVVEIDSESDSNTDSKSDDDSDVEYLNEIRKTIEKSIDDVDAEDDDIEEEGCDKSKRQPLRVKGEFLIDDLPPIEDLHITVPEDECVELGKVHSIVEQLVLVSALPDSILLDLDTVLFLDKGERVLGEVFDVLGQVADPLYCVRFNSNQQIKEKNIQVGDVVFVAPKTEHTQYLILANLMKMRGSDASWENDVEPPPQYLAYSDDEQEKAARAKLRNKNRKNDNNDTSKRLCSEIIDISSSSSPSPSPMPVALVPSPYPRQPFNQQSQSRGGVARGRRGGNYRPPYLHNAQNYHNPNYHSGSWHSHYPQHYARPQFGGPQHVMHPQPPNFLAQTMHGGQPYGLRTQPPQILHHPPSPLDYRPNLYESQNSVLSSNHQTPMFTTSSPPPPPPGAQ